MDVLGYNYPQIASAYSTFAGVLAGFVFAVIGYLLGSRGTQRRATRKYESALSWAILAFIGLSVSCFLYGVISGKDRFVAGTTLPSIRPFYLSMFASGVFTSSLVILLVGLIWLFHGDEATLSVMTQLRIAVYFTSLTALLFLSGLFSAIFRIQNSSMSGGPTPWITIISVWLPAIVIGESAGLVMRRSPQGVQTSARLIAQVILLVMMFVGAGLVEAFGVGIQQGSSDIYQILQDFQPVALAALGVVIFLCVLNLPGRVPKKQ